MYSVVEVIGKREGVKGMDNSHRMYMGIPLNVSDLDDPETSGLRYEDIQFDDTELFPREYDLLFDLFTEFNSGGVMTHI